MKNIIAFEELNESAGTFKLDVDGRDLGISVGPRTTNYGFGKKRKGSNTIVSLRNGTSDVLSFTPTEFHEFVAAINKIAKDVKEL
jgi:hypothetical protein